MKTVNRDLMLLESKGYEFKADYYGALPTSILLRLGLEEQSPYAYNLIGEYEVYWDDDIPVPVVISLSVGAYPITGPEEYTEVSRAELQDLDYLFTDIEETLYSRADSYGWYEDRQGELIDEAMERMEDR